MYFIFAKQRSSADSRELVTPLRPARIGRGRPYISRRLPLACAVGRGPVAKPLYELPLADGGVSDQSPGLVRGSASSSTLSPRDSTARDPQVVEGGSARRPRRWPPTCRAPPGRRCASAQSALPRRVRRHAAARGSQWSSSGPLGNPRRARVRAHTAGAPAATGR